LAGRHRPPPAHLKARAATPTRLNRGFTLLPDAIDPARLWEQLADPGLAMVLGRAHPGPEGVPRSHREALAVIPYAVPGGIRRYDEILIPRVLEGDRDARRDFLEQLLDPIYRARSGAVLVRSLLCYAEHGFLRNRAAAALHIHSNTLRYRLERVTDLAGLDLHDPGTRFQLQLAAQLLSTQDKNGS